MSRPEIAFQGAVGAFSHEACLRFASDHTPVAFEAFADVFDAVRSGRCERAMVPRENSSAGPVPEVVALLPVSGLRVLDEVRLPIRLFLLARPGVALDALDEAASHPMALKQCRASLTRLGLRAVEAFDTAGAAREVAERGPDHRAAVAPETAAALYGLTAVAHDLQDEPDNTTMFVLLGR